MRNPFIKPHARHVLVAAVVLAILLLVAAVAARSADFSTYSGKQLYIRFCANCHGEEGLGNGIVAGSLKVEVPDLTRIARRHGGKFTEDDIRRIIDGRKTIPAHGFRTMPVWGVEFSSQNLEKPDPKATTDDMIGRLSGYLWSIQR